MATDWDQALARVVKAVRQGGSAVLLASGRASTESLGMVKRLLEGTKLTAAVQLPQGDEAPLKGVPNLALRKERAPNGEGARIAGLQHGMECGAQGRIERVARRPARCGAYRG